MSNIPKEAIAEYINQKVDQAVERRLSTSIFKKPKLPDWFMEPIETNNETGGSDNFLGTELFEGKELSLEKAAPEPEYSTIGFGLAGELSMSMSSENSSQHDSGVSDSSNDAGDAGLSGSSGGNED